MSNANDYGRVALDKAEELEKRFKMSQKAEIVPDYAEKTVTETCVSSATDNRVIKRIRWKLYSDVGGQITVDIKIKQGENVNIYFLYNEEVIFDTAIKGGRALFQRGGHIPVGINEIEFELSAEAEFAVDITVTYRGRFVLLSEPDRVSLVCGGGYAFLSDGKFTVYDGATDTELFSVYGVICAGAAKLANGNYCVATETFSDGASIKIISAAGKVISSVKPDGRFTSFAVAASGSVATVYAARQSRLTVFTFNGQTLSEEKTAVRAVELGYAESSDVKLLRVRNPIGYEYVYKV